jgi:Aerotolerance regulator N-terminal/von Willebrand factor type A domain
MGFFAPWFLAGLAALGLPVFVHLLRRHTTIPRPVSSLMFFEAGTQSSTRHRRLRYLLLFALRALLILLLVLAFANPFIRRAKASTNDKLLLVVVDNSFSMRAGSRFADARQGALNVLSHRGGSQRAQVLVLGGKLEVLTQPIADSAQLSAAVNSIQPGDGHGNFGELGRGMRAMTESVHTPIELHLFSDMQTSNMPGNFADMVMPGNVALMLHPVGAAMVPNWTVESVEAPSQLVDPKKTRVLAVIAGHATPAASRTASLVVNGTVVATRKIDVPASGRATVAFESLDVPYGLSKCEVRIDAADGFPADDTLLFAVKRADPERVLFLHQASDSRSPLYFGAALAAAAQASFVLQPITPEQAADVDPSKYAFVVLSDVTSLPSILEHSLLKHVEGGGGVLIALGTSAAHRENIPIFGGSTLDGRYYSRGYSEGLGFATVGAMDASYPSMHDAATWPELKFFYATIVDPAKSRVVATLADKTPLLLDRQIGEGHALVFASGLDNISNDMPLHPMFVPFVERTARYLSGADRLSGARVVDSYLQLRDTSSKVTGSPSVDVVGPGGQRPLSLTEAATAQSFPLAHAGFYQVRYSTGREALVAANPDRRESDLEQIPADTLKLWSGATDTEAATTPAAQAAQTNSYQSSLWWWVMLSLLIVALAESVLASRYLGTLREQP